MSSITLKVTPEEMVAAADDVSEQISAVKKAFDSLGTTITSSVSYWEGNASSLHQNQYKEASPKIEEVLKLMKNRPDVLLKMAGLYKAAESENTAATEGLSNDLIS